MEECLDTSTLISAGIRLINSGFVDLLESVRETQPRLAGCGASLGQRESPPGCPEGAWEAPGTSHFSPLLRNLSGFSTGPSPSSLPGPQVRRRLTTRAIRCPGWWGRGCAGLSQPMSCLPTLAVLHTPEKSLRLNAAQPGPQILGRQ